MCGKYVQTFIFVRLGIFREKMKNFNVEDENNVVDKL